MPTYEYVCQKCGHAFEAFQSMRDASLTKCPKCRKSALKRLVGSGAGLIFKGTGFYITDYKNKGGGKKEGGEGKGGEGSGGEGKPAEGKPAESKPAEGKPAESKPAEKKSSSESKPASDSKSGGGSKSSSRPR